VSGRAATSVTVRPSLITARMACYRCLVTLSSLIRECQGSTGSDVNHQAELCNASFHWHLLDLGVDHVKINPLDLSRPADNQSIRLVETDDEEHVAAPRLVAESRELSCPGQLWPSSVALDQVVLDLLATSYGFDDIEHLDLNFLRTHQCIMPVVSVDAADLFAV
jgi:hypothetical protein